MNINYGTRVSLRLDIIVNAKGASENDKNSARKVRQRAVNRKQRMRTRAAADKGNGTADSNVLVNK